MSPPALIVIGQSARALAVGARWAGYAPLAVDLFGDADALAASMDAITLPGGLAAGVTGAAALAAVEALAARHAPVGLVYGSGFEAAPAALAELARRVPLIGNAPATVAAAKDPLAFARACADLGIAHPEVAAAHPREPGGRAAFGWAPDPHPNPLPRAGEGVARPSPARGRRWPEGPDEGGAESGAAAPARGWLVKARGGAGGGHVAPAGTAAPRAASAQYYQRRVAGEAASALFLADGRQARIVGFSAQWTSPTRDAPFRYGGAAGPVALAPRPESAIRRAVAALAAHFALRGLNSADFLIDGEATWLIEVNPRPGATLDIFDRDTAPLIAAHSAACAGRLASPPPFVGARAAEVVYAAAAMTAPAGLTWPAWTADRPRAGTRIGAGEPVCTVLAAADDAATARALVAARAREVLDLAKGAGG